MSYLLGTPLVAQLSKGIDMNKLMMALAATTMAAAPLATASAEAAPRHNVQKTVKIKKAKNGKRTVVTKRTVIQPRRAQLQNRRWARGQRFDRRYAANYRVINNPRAYGVGYAPRGYRWAQSGRDLVLFRINTGLISNVYYGRIR